jgi:signal transduction histidine kinase
MNGLLTSILFFGKADAEMMSYEPVRIHTSEFLNEVVDIVKAGIDNDVKIVTKFDKLPEMITSDIELLYQILENLLSNAVKYSKDGGVVAFKVRHADDILKISIKDEGIGILSSEQPQLFSRFFRGKNVGLREGSGLGLSIVKKCVDVIGGEIEFTSEVKKGTEFRLKIPTK